MRNGSTTYVTIAADASGTQADVTGYTEHDLGSGWKILAPVAKGKDLKLTYSGVAQIVILPFFQSTTDAADDTGIEYGSYWKLAGKDSPLFCGFFNRTELEDGTFSPWSPQVVITE